MRGKNEGRNQLRSVGLGTLVALGLAGCGQAAASDVDESLRYGEAEVRNILLRVEAAGQIQPVRLVEVKSNAGGEILRLHVDTGDEVERGSLLAEIDPRDVRSNVNQARADTEVARASLMTREAQLRRAVELREANIMTVQEFEAAQLDVANARAQLIRAETNLQLAEERMGDITIRAPISGTIVSKQVEAGQIVASATSNVSGGSPLLVMADLSEMQVRTLVDQTDIGNIHLGMTARVSVDAYPGRTFTGEIAKIEPQAVVEQNVTMFPVIIHLANPDRLLLPGMNADVEVTVQERRGVVTVPNGAVLNPRDGLVAATLLGLSEEEYQRRVQASVTRTVEGESQAPAGAPAQAGGASAECAALMQRVSSGGPQGLSEADRARLGECRTQLGGAVAGRGGAAGAGGGAAGGRAGAFGGGAARTGGQSGRDSGSRGAILIVETSTGPEPRMVQIGAYDLDYTEVISGVEAGERVLMMSVAQLEQRQQQQLDQMRQRAGAGSMPGVPTAAPGGPGFGGPGGAGGGRR
jgi:HlyD family secretion protein